MNRLSGKVFLSCARYGSHSTGIFSIELKAQDSQPKVWIFVAVQIGKVAVGLVDQFDVTDHRHRILLRRKIYLGGPC